MLAAIVARARSLWHGLRRRSAIEADMTEEFEAHIALRANDLMRAGLPASDATRQARIEFGGVDRYKEAARVSRGLGFVRDFRASWLDLKLGARMLVKYPGLTLVGGLAIAVAIAIGAVFDVMAGLVDSTLPLDEGERIVAIESWDSRWNDQEPRILHDYIAWREELETIDDLGAYRNVQRNLITADRAPEPVVVAEMTASGFRLARVAPVRGRPLVADDELEGSPPVVVIGYDLWRDRFAADRDIVGRTLQLGAANYTIVGVMPEGFAFPLNHRLWVPFRADPSDYERRQGPGIMLVGRLAPGVTLDAAQAELTAIGLRAAADFPQTHERLRPRVVPYTLHLFDDMEGWELDVARLLVTMLLVIVCATVATLVYARTATRRGEIAVRSALGASRRRIVAQLFVEALVLAGVAAVVGLAIAAFSLRRLDDALTRMMGDWMPFWMEIDLSLRTVAYVLALTVIAAVVVGVVPAMRATGRRLQTGLQRLGAGASEMRFGGTWTALIVIQVAFAVAILPIAVSTGSTFLAYGFARPGAVSEEFLTARLSMDREIPATADVDEYDRAYASRYSAIQTELVRRLAAEPGVSDVIPMTGVPGMEASVRIEVDSGSGSATSGAVETERDGERVGTRHVAIEYFDAFGIPLLAGRRFHSGDIAPAAAMRVRDADGDGFVEAANAPAATATVVIVNQSFVDRILRGGNAVGRRVRYLGREEDADPERWYEIVGVVPDFPARKMEPDMTDARVYHPLPPGQFWSLFALRVRGSTPMSFATRLREITAAIDPAARLNEIRTLDDLLREEHSAMRLTALALALLTVSVLLLSAAGIYALMSFTVAQRRREIGIRAALGADPRRILGSIFVRALLQLSAGVVVGVVVAAFLAGALGDDEGGAGWSVPVVSALVMIVGLLAAVGPARRGLRIQPTEALRAD